MEACEGGEEMSHTDTAGKGGSCRRKQKGSAQKCQPCLGAFMEAREAEKDTREMCKCVQTLAVRTLTML